MSRPTDRELSTARLVVDRVVRARISDPVDAEDLTQETLARVIAAWDDVGPDDLESFVATVALNVMRDQWRRTATADVKLPHLIDLREPERPDDVAVDAEMSDALHGALAQLPADRRDALLAHELSGVTTAELAGPTSSPGAMASSLARTRAHLRVGFLLAHRRVDLPTDACRPVLDAVSSADSRRRARLDVEDHLAHCATCAELAPLLRRGGGIWLGVAALVAPTLKRRKRELGAAAAATAVVGALILTGGADADDVRPDAASGVAAPPTESPTPVGEAAPSADAPADRTDLDAPAETPPDASAPPPSPQPSATPGPQVVVEDADQQPEASSPDDDELRPAVHLPRPSALLGSDVVADHPLLSPLEPVACELLEMLGDAGLPLSCRSSEPSDLALLGG
ncbi:RNA polymerase sigma factor [Actinospongicola halichondriae]|uniref:RNA polymerase sigma factor n=1 Tax=Actinospongicola halichondriae TaxID=3236844 RepID=UPI003D484976